VMKTIAERMDIDDVPRNGRHIAVDPGIYYKMLDDNEIVSTDYNRNTGGDRGRQPPSLHFMGFDIHPTNRLADVRALGTAAYAKHSQQLGTDYVSTKFDHTLAVAWQEDWAVGVVKLKELGMQSEYMLEYLATLMVGGFSVGHGVLHESACYVVDDTA
jgi:hypothetical protein